MTDTRDPRVAELVTRLVEQAPPAPPFPDEITAHPQAPRRRVAVAGAAIAAALIIASVVFVASRPKNHPAPASPSTTSTPPPTTALASLPVVQPSALAVGSDGTLYVADKGTHRIIAISNGVRRVVAQVDDPRGLAFDHEGDLYVADDSTNTVLRIARDGRVTTYAGDGTAGFAGDGKPATRARLQDPTALVFGPDDALYIADSANGRIRRVTADGTISTFAGNGSPAQTGDGGPALEAGLDPVSLAFDGAGNLVVFQFDTKAIRRIAPNGIISSLPKPLYAAGLATTPDGYVDVADYGGFGISRISPDGTVSALPFEHPGLFRPTAIAVAANGDVYVADDGLGMGGPTRIMRVHADGTSVDVTPGAQDVPLDSRSAAAAVPYVQSLAAQGRLPHSETIRSVRADGEFVVVSTSIADSARATELWEALSRELGCDDGHLFVRGYHVLLADGSVVDKPRPGFVYCAGT
jgi:sugar lactone lactonase YvrE